MMEYYSLVEAWLANTYNIKVSSEWLSACLEWIEQESQIEAIPDKDVRHQVFEQWLCSDLAEIGEASLPRELECCDKMELVSNYPLQIQSIVDVGFPLYGQQQKIMGQENSNEQVSADKPLQPAWEPKQSRMLLLTLTDGHSEIKAMEYQPIRSLDTQHPYGMKCVISGTVLCRRGMILLTEEHLHLLGGEVDAPTESNQLTVLQNAMLKNREDEGKTAKQQFSGKFVTRGSSKKVDHEKKALPSMKREFSGFNSQKFPHTSRFDPHSGGKDSKPVITSMSRVKTKVKTEQAGSSSYNNFQAKKSQDIEFSEWEEDVDYANLLDADMDFEDAPSSCVKPVPTNRLPDVTDRLPVTNNVKSSFYPGATTDNPNKNLRINANKCKVESNLSSNFSSGAAKVNQVQLTNAASSKSHRQDADIGWFDGDVADTDMDEIFEDTILPWELNSQKPKSCQGSSSGLKSKSSDCSSQSKTNLSKNKIDDDNSENDSQAQSQSILCSSINNAPKPTTMPINSCVNKKPLFSKRDKSNVEEIAASQSGRGSKLKRQKIQTKVSDLFRKQSKPSDHSASFCNTEVKSEDTKTTISGAIATKSPNVAEMEFPSTGQTVVKTDRSFCDGGTEMKATATNSQVPLKAVIQPVSPVASSGSGSRLDKSTLQSSDLNSSQTSPATVKVSILTLIEKLCSNHGSHWSLACKISDGNSKFDVDISNEVLTGLIGFSSADSIAMRIRFKAEPELKQQFSEGLSHCQKTLMSYRTGCLVKIDPASRNERGNRPVITRLSPLSTR